LGEGTKKEISRGFAHRASPQGAQQTMRSRRLWKLERGRTHQKGKKPLAVISRALETNRSEHAGRDKRGTGQVIVHRKSRERENQKVPSPRIRHNFGFIYSLGSASKRSFSTGRREAEGVDRLVVRTKGRSASQTIRKKPSRQGPDFDARDCKAAEDKKPKGRRLRKRAGRETGKVRS